MKTFSSEERRVFCQIVKKMGGPSVEELCNHLGADVYDDQEDELNPRIDEPLLRQAGLVELSMLLTRLGFKERRSLIRRLPGLDGRSVRRTADEPPASAGVLRSLQASLFGPGHQGLDVEVRAGLHRLGRATADLDASSFMHITANLPATWRRCCKAAWLRLSQLDECRDSAEWLRQGLCAGGDS